MFNPREAALGSLIKWEVSGAFSNIELNTVISRSPDAQRNDISLYTLLFLGVIEKKLLLDKIIEKYSRVKLDEIEVDIKNVLRLGIYQLIFTDKIPEYSAVDQSVKLAPKKAKGFVNAILRSFIRDEKKYDLPSDRLEKISLEYSVPMELIKVFVDSYGIETAEKILTLDEKKSPLCLRVNTLKTSQDELISKIKAREGSFEISQIASDIIKTSLPISSLTDLIDSGEVFVQDESSRIASCVLMAKPGERIADVCACPGGKSFSIAIDMQNKGELYSSDLHASKLSLIEKGAKRLGIDIISTRVQNAKEFVPENEGAYDRVLCDVPCSGLGVIFKKPDIKYKTTESYKNLPSVQYDILKTSSKYVKKGGVLVYSTCTLNKEENENVIEKFLLENEDFEVFDFEVGEIKSTKGGYTFFPHISKTDGFFVARIRRKNDK